MQRLASLFLFGFFVLSVSACSPDAVTETARTASPPMEPVPLEVTPPETTPPDTTPVEPEPPTPDTPQPEITPPEPAVPEVPLEDETEKPVLESVGVTVADTRTLKFTWNGEAEHYKLLVNADGVSGYSPVVEDIPGEQAELELEVPVHLTKWQSAQYMLEACNGESCSESDSETIGLEDLLEEDAVGYFKASNPSSSARAGDAIAISADGRTMAVGAPYESSVASNSGAVYIFERVGLEWQQRGHLKAAFPEYWDDFGRAVALTANGDMLVVGASRDDSVATGIDGDASNNDATESGAVFVFQRGDDGWVQTAFIKASNTGVLDIFGGSVDVSDNGSVIVVGANGEDSNSREVNGDQSNNDASSAGAAYVFEQVDGGAWLQTAYLKADNANASDRFGREVAVSGNGNVIAVGAPFENGLVGDSGAVYIFSRNSEGWQQDGYLKASNPGLGDAFGNALSLSQSGEVLAIGAQGEDSGYADNPSDNSKSGSGAAYVFNRDETGWSQQAYLKHIQIDSAELFGISLSLERNGRVLAIGAMCENNFSTGVDGNLVSSYASESGAVIVFEERGGEWLPASYIKAPNTDSWDYFGYSVALSTGGNTLAVGAPGEDSGINGNQADNSRYDSGAAYIY